MEITKPDSQKTVAIDSQAEEKAFVAHPSFGQAFSFWLKLGFISFGGPAGQISIMYQELVEKRRWVSNISVILIAGGIGILQGFILQ